MPLLPPLLAVCALTICALGRSSDFVWCPPAVNSDQQYLTRVKRQEADGDSEDYVADYAGNNNDEPPSPISEPKDTFREDDFGDMNMDKGNDDMNEDKFGTDTDTFDNSVAEDKKKSVEEESEEPKPKKKTKKHKYLKKTLDFLKRVLDPNKLMQNAYITEMLRRFSHHEEPDYESKESSEEEEIHTPKPAKSRRGRPKKKDKIPPGITGIIKKGVMSLTQIELDKRKLRRRMRMIKRFARKAKKPLKTAVKIFLSSRNQGMGGYGGGGFDNNNY